MCASISSIFVFCIFYTVPGRTLATENGYILYEVEKIVCKNSSSAISECSGFLDYDIPDLSNTSFSANLSGIYDFRKQTPFIISSLKLLGEQCSRLHLVRNIFVTLFIHFDVKENISRLTQKRFWLHVTTAGRLFLFRRVYSRCVLQLLFYTCSLQQSTQNTANAQLRGIC